MKTNTIVWVVLILIIVVGGGWWYYSNYMETGEYGAPNPSGDAGINGSPNQGNLGQPDNGTPQTPQTSATVLQASSNASLGSFLTSPVTGMTLYSYSPDTPGVSNCNGQCAVNWPPYIVEPGVTLAGAAGISGQLGTFTRADGSLQLTYKGVPLYTYIKDKQPGDTVGQGVGGVWYVVKP